MGFWQRRVPRSYVVAGAIVFVHFVGTTTAIVVARSQHDANVEAVVQPAKVAPKPVTLAAPALSDAEIDYAIEALVTEATRACTVADCSRGHAIIEKISDALDRDSIGLVRDTWARQMIDRSAGLPSDQRLAVLRNVVGSDASEMVRSEAQMKLDEEEGPVIERARSLVLTDPVGAKDLLMPRVMGPRASREEAELLKVVCRELHDSVCVQSVAEVQKSL